MREDPRVFILSRLGYGRCRLAVKAPVCGTGTRGFESRLLPHLELLSSSFASSAPQIFF